MKKGKLIGKGMTSEVYEWGEDKVLKLYLKKFDDDRVKREVEIGNTVHEAGVSSPPIFDIVNVDNRRGIIFQRILGKSILRQVEEEPWKLDYYTRQMAEFHFKIHQCSTDKLPAQKERLATAIRKSSELLGSKWKKILVILQTLPNGTSICHGDLHFENIIVSEQGLIAIDWTNAYKGNPLGDVARTCLTISSPTMPLGASNTMIVPYMYGRWLTYWTYLNQYMSLSKARFEDIDAWILPMAAARLSEKIPGEEMWLMTIINKCLTQLDT